MIVSGYRSSLPDVVNDINRGLSNADRRRIVKQLTVRLRHLHDANIIHGGVNAQAILLNDQTNKIDAVFSLWVKKTFIDYYNKQIFNPYLVSPVNESNFAPFIPVPKKY